MCRKYINTIARCYDDVEYCQNTYMLKKQFDSILIKYDEDKLPYIGGFYIVTDINILGTGKPENYDQNELEQGKKLKFKVRITKLNKDSQAQYSWDLDTFEVDTAEKSEEACVKFINTSKIVKINRLYLEKDDFKGKYAIKVLVEDDNKKWDILTITGLYVFDEQSYC